jgi:hypothetical protein
MLKDRVNHSLRGVGPVREGFRMTAPRCGLRRGRPVELRGRLLAGMGRAKMA